MSQLDFTGSETPATVTLTRRQQMAWLHVRHHQPATADEIGALLHEDAKARGLQGHGSDTRCDFCGRDGRQMLVTLRRKQLVNERRGIGWVLAGARTERPKPPGLSEDIPF